MQPDTTHRTFTFFAWGMAVFALGASAGVCFFGWHIAQGERAYAAERANAQDQLAREAAAIRTHALVAETTDERAQLTGIFNVDVIHAADLILTAGKAAGVEVQLGNAAPDQSPTGDASVSAIGLSVQAKGTFPQLMHALELFEALPLPSTIGHFDLSLVPDSGATPLWSLNVYLRVFSNTLTTS